MAGLLEAFLAGFTLSGDHTQDAPAFLRHHGRDGVARHVELVAAHAGRLAIAAGADEAAAVTAAWLHDISLALPYPSMPALIRRCGVELLPEELAAPQLLHGKLSALFAEQIFGVDEPVVLDAIRCHTTLRSHPTLVDKVLFIADKLAWHPHEAPFADGLAAALERSLDQAVAFFLDWSWRQRYPVVHPWLREAYAEFCTGE